MLLSLETSVPGNPHKPLRRTRLELGAVAAPALNDDQQPEHEQQVIDPHQDVIEAEHEILGR